MRRRPLVSLVTALSLLLLASHASGESQTMSGKGDLRKMTATNGDNAVKVKLFGFKGPCEAKQFSIDVFWGTNPRYQVQAACTAGTTWTKGLYYDGNRNDDQGAMATKRVSCSGFRLKYDPSGKVWTATIPRGCIGKAANRVRVSAEGVNYAGSPIPGEAGPTRRLARG